MCHVALSTLEQIRVGGRWKKALRYFSYFTRLLYLRPLRNVSCDRIKFLCLPLSFTSRIIFWSLSPRLHVVRTSTYAVYERGSFLPDLDRWWLGSEASSPYRTSDARMVLRGLQFESAYSCLHEAVHSVRKYYDWFFNTGYPKSSYLEVFIRIFGRGDSCGRICKVCLVF